MNNKGFTLVELLATIVVLAMVISIGTYAITGIINNAKEKNYQLLIANTKDGAEVYYQECKYSSKVATNTRIGCTSITENGVVKYQTTLGDLVNYGYLKGNKQDAENDKKFTIVNPKDDVTISECTINVWFDDSSKTVKVSAINPSGSCPKEY